MEFLSGIAATMRFPASPFTGAWAAWYRRPAFYFFKDKTCCRTALQAC